MKGRNLLTLGELTSKEITELLDVAEHLKKERLRGAKRAPLEGRSLAMIFQKPSTRTRVSLEVAMYELGGHALNLSASDLQLGRGETLEDTARALSRYVDVISARVYGHEDVVTLADASTVPVINALSDLYHPCQALADLLTVREVKGKVAGVKVTWVGDGSNVCNSLMIGCAKLGAEFRLCSPRAYLPRLDILNSAFDFARRGGGTIATYDDAKGAVRGADVVVTDSFVPMGKEQERGERTKAFLPRYQVNEEIMALASREAVFMHCLPAKRGEEVAGGVIDGPRSVVWQEAENRLHTQKALLCLLLLDESEKIFA